jgi:hypothetical protein
MWVLWAILLRITLLRGLFACYSALKGIFASQTRKLSAAASEGPGIGVNFLWGLVVSHVEADANLTYHGRLDLE